MKFLSDWKFWLFLITTANMFLTGFAFLIMKFNDLKHLDKDMKFVGKELKEIKDKVGDLSERVSKIEGKLE